jgi:hypothetical protein
MATGMNRADFSVSEDLINARRPARSGLLRKLVALAKVGIEDLLDDTFAGLASTLRRLRR